MEMPLKPEDFISHQINERLESIEKLLQELVELTRQSVENSQNK